MKLKMTDKHKLMAYILNKEMGYNMSDIASLMGVAQSTISSAIKEVGFRRTITNLEKALTEAKETLIGLGYNEPMILPPNDK